MPYKSDRSSEISAISVFIKLNPNRDFVFSHKYLLCSFLNFSINSIRLFY